MQRRLIGHCRHHRLNALIADDSDEEEDSDESDSDEDDVDDSVCLPGRPLKF